MIFGQRRGEAALAARAGMRAPEDELPVLSTPQLAKGGLG
jgi:hypothetical protein